MERRPKTVKPPVVSDNFFAYPQASGGSEDNLNTSMKTLSFHVPLSSSPEQEEPLYIYCNAKPKMKQLINDIATCASNPSKSHIFLDCEGRHLGRINGKLGLVQIGVGKHVYLIDVITYPRCLGTLKNILENAKIEKIMWDGRSDFAELWHGNGIVMKPVLDLQLVRVYISSGVIKGNKDFIKLEGMGDVFRACSRTTLIESGIDLERFARGFSTCNLLG